MKRGLLHYAPEDGWFGDPMPVYADGVYHIYYTKLSDKQGWLCWGHVATRDWKEYQELPDCLLPDDRDVSLTTGSVLYHEGVYHAFLRRLRDGRYLSDFFRRKPRWRAV